MLNRTTIQGRLTRDPEFKQTDTGTAVATFTVAWSEKYKDKEIKLFLPCVAWGNNAMFLCQYFVKGSEIIVDGKLTSRKWQDKEGNNRESIELTVERMHFAGSKQATTDATTEAPEPTGNPIKTPDGFAPADDDVLPF